MSKNRDFWTISFFKLALSLASAMEKWILFFRQKMWRKNQASLATLSLLAGSPMQTSASIQTVKLPNINQFLSILWMLPSKMFPFSQRKRIWQLDLVCIYVSPTTSLAAEEIICCTHANFLKTPRNTNQLSFLANVWKSQFLYCKMNNCKSHNDKTIEEHTSLKSAFHCFHSCRLHPFYPW